MLEKIARVVGISYNENDAVTMALLNRIYSKMDPSVTTSHPAINAIIKKAEEDVNMEGQLAIVSLVKAMTAPIPEKMMKIKSSPKGARIKVAAANGVRFSFGPVWNESVKRCKGVAVVDANRAKLNHQAIMYGIESPDSMSATDLCAILATKI